MGIIELPFIPPIPVPTVPIPDWVSDHVPFTKRIDNSVPNALNRVNLPDVKNPSTPPIGFQGANPAQQRHADRAKEDYGAMQKDARLVRDENGKLVAKQFTNKPNTADVWPYGQVTAAALDRALVTGDVDEAKKAMSGLEKYMQSDVTFSAHPNVSMVRFLDDNAWIGLDYVQAFRLTGDQKYVDGARKVQEFLMRNMREDGGVYWSESKDYVNAATVGPTLQLTLHLYGLTHDQKYLDQAKKLDGFLSSLRTGPGGQVIDGVKPNGKREEAIFTYNQGTAMGADIQMYELTGDESKLQRAKDLAKSTLAYFDDQRLYEHAPPFNAILFRNMLQVDAYAPELGIRDKLERYLSRAEQNSRNNDGLYGGNGLGRYEGKDEDGTGSIDQSAFVQMHSLLAMSKEQLKTVS